MVKLVEFCNDFFKKYPDDPRYKILILQLYVEHYVNELLCHFSQEVLHKTIRTYLVFPKKLDFLVKQAIITEEHKSILICLNSIRDEFVHELEIKPSRINELLNSHSLEIHLKYNITTSNKHFNEEFNFKDIYKKYNTPKATQLDISVVCLLGYLDFQLNKLKGTEISEIIYPELKIDDVTKKLMVVFHFFEHQKV